MRTIAQQKDTQCKVWIGTSGYSFYCWEGALYRPGITQREMLPAYAAQFDTVELNYSYYRMPTVKTSAGMVKKTPKEFQFFAKIHQDISHKGTLAGADQFKEGLEPLRVAGKLSGLLLQFPQAFHDTRDNRDHLRNTIDAFRDYPLAVEFRHRSWAKTEVYRFLESNKSCLVSVDAPTIPALFPKTSVQTAGFGYIRLHSRNASKWYKSGEDRYDYHYSDQELEEWLPVLDAFSERASNVFVYFNNCHRGQAAENARAMKKIIKQAGLDVSLPEINRSAETVEGGLWRRD